MEEVDIENYFTEPQFELLGVMTQAECYIDEYDMYFTISKN